MADETVMVVAGPKAEPGRVVLWERDAMHPDQSGPHEVYVTAPAEGEDAVPVKVGRTPAVEGKLRTGELVEAAKAAAPKASPKE
jgi:hypothetical protein